MKKERVWKLNLVLWSIALVASIVGIGLWLHKYFTTGETEWLPIFLFLCCSFSSIMWIVIYRREKKKGE